MSDLASKLFKALRQMDSEANVDRNGHPTGLNWYGGYARPELKRPQTEPEWTKRLAKILPAMGLPTKAEARYPGLPAGRLNRCDLVITESDGGRLWLEIKGAWKTWWVDKGSEAIYRAYLFHPVLPDLPPKSHTAVLDVKKLSVWRQLEFPIALRQLSCYRKGGVASHVLLPSRQSKEATWQSSVERPAWNSSSPSPNATGHRPNPTKRASSMSSYG